MHVTMTVNGEEVERDIEPRVLLVHFLREDLGLTGTHWGCDTSNCGTCVVQLDGEPVKSCTVLAAMADGHAVRTVEGLATGGQLDPIQQGFIETSNVNIVSEITNLISAQRAYEMNSKVIQAADQMSGTISNLRG